LIWHLYIHEFYIKNFNFYDANFPEIIFLALAWPQKTAQQSCRLIFYF